MWKVRPVHLFYLHNKLVRTNSKCSLSYIQGQHADLGFREYFYYVDHQGMLFLDDARMKNFTSCFKEKQFLRFFFNQLKLNKSNRYTEFPYMSLCGKERNYVRCDDCPFVFTRVIEKIAKNIFEIHLAYNNVDVLSLKFEPEKVLMLSDTGRLYHPAPERAGAVGLIHTKLAAEFSNCFVFESADYGPPTHFVWRDTTYTLDNGWYLMTKEKDEAC